jgi:hypothetical protein
MITSLGLLSTEEKLKFFISTILIASLNFYQSFYNFNNCFITEKKENIGQFLKEVIVFLFWIFFFIRFRLWLTDNFFGNSYIFFSLIIQFNHMMF